MKNLWKSFVVLWLILNIYASTAPTYWTAAGSCFYSIHNYILRYVILYCLNVTALERLRNFWSLRKLLRATCFWNVCLLVWELQLFSYIYMLMRLLFFIILWWSSLRLSFEPKNLIGSERIWNVSWNKTLIYNFAIGSYWGVQFVDRRRTKTSNLLTRITLYLIIWRNLMFACTCKSLNYSYWCGLGFIGLELQIIQALSVRAGK